MSGSEVRGDQPPVVLPEDEVEFATGGLRVRHGAECRGLGDYARRIPPLVAHCSPAATIGRCHSWVSPGPDQSGSASGSWLRVAGWQGRRFGGLGLSRRSVRQRIPIGCNHGPCEGQVRELGVQRQCRTVQLRTGHERRDQAVGVAAPESRAPGWGGVTGGVGWLDPSRRHPKAPSWR
jgi:hypothetical protein